MGNCSIMRRKQRKRIALLLVGLDNAGKTTTAKSLVGENPESVVPTVGFSSVTLNYRRHTVVLYDLGGGSRIRGIWPKYFADVHGIIFVVDASDVSRLDEGRKVLQNLLAHELLAGKPMLLLANKQDCSGALDELDIVEKLDVETIVNEYRSPTLVEICSANGNHKRKWRKHIDPGIKNGYRWLVNVILRDFETLNKRVENDSSKLQKPRDKVTTNGHLCLPNNNEHKDVHNSGKSFEYISDVVEPVSIIPVEELVTNVPGAVVETESSNNISINCVEKEYSNNRLLQSLALDVVPNRHPSITDGVKEHIQLDTGFKPKKFKLRRKLNRTAPAPMGEMLQLTKIKEPLPPIEGKTERCCSAPVYSSRRSTAWTSGKSVGMLLPPMPKPDQEKIITPERK